MSAAVGRAVPAYFHPALDPLAWDRLARAALGSGFVVLNVADGPGSEPDPVYAATVARLRRAGAPVVGYLDTGYGDRATGEVLLGADRFREWYGVTGVFLDRVAAGPEGLDRHRMLVALLREGGADRVVGNHGTVPDPGYAALADVLVTFEGPWREHRRHRPPEWVRSLPVPAVCHLVHSVPAPVTSALVAGRARRAGAGIVCVTRAGGANPWDRLPLGIG